MMQPGDQLLLFTYGTLKRGEKNHPAIMSDMYLRETSTSRNYMLVDLGPYPGMIENLKDGFSVKGELFKIPISVNHMFCPHLTVSVDTLKTISACKDFPLFFCEEFIAISTFVKVIFLLF